MVLETCLKKPLSKWAKKSLLWKDWPKEKTNLNFDQQLCKNGKFQRNQAAQQLQKNYTKKLRMKK